MRMNLHRNVLAMFALVPLCASAAVVDRVAIVINKKVITEGEVMDELRLTEFLNNQPLDLGLSALRAAAEHLIDQELIRSEMELSGYAPRSAVDADELLRRFRQERSLSAATYRAALEKYGITEEQLKQRLIWQVTALRFTDLRFRSDLPVTNSESADRGDETANNVDEQMEAWLKQARGNAKITFKKEAFE
jgi:hypothetical protein